jgi:hypothetical protein
MTATRSLTRSQPRSSNPAREHVFLTVEETAERYRTSVKSIHDKTRTNRIPYLKRDGFRRLLFPLADLERWDAGAELELVTLPDGRAVRAQTVRKALEAA